MRVPSSSSSVTRPVESMPHRRSYPGPSTDLFVTQGWLGLLGAPSVFRRVLAGLRSGRLGVRLSPIANVKSDAALGRVEGGSRIGHLSASAGTRHFHGVSITDGG